MRSANPTWGSSDRARLLSRFFGSVESEAERLLRALSPQGASQDAGEGYQPIPDFTWIHSGMMHLTGHRAGAPLAPRAPIGSRLRAALRILNRLAPQIALPSIGEIFSARACGRGWQRSGRTSLNGTCRLVKTKDRWVALNLTRASDAALIPALIGFEPEEEIWEAIAAAAGAQDAASFCGRAQLLGLPIATLGESSDRAPVTYRHLGARGRSRPRPFVVDLSAMWAGPLCARLLRQSGASVVKVESVQRPDGARSGDENFFNWLHAGHKSVALDFHTADGARALKNLLERADIVIEASRPRAMAALGIDPAEFLAARAGRVWLSITGYGRSSEHSHRVAFGDDAAVAGGLVGFDERGEPVFCADAMADPLSGLCGAIAVFCTLAAGGGALIELSMSGVAAYFAADDSGREVEDYILQRCGNDWVVRGKGALTCVKRPEPLERAPAAPAFGAHTYEFTNGTLCAAGG